MNRPVMGSMPGTKTAWPGLAREGIPMSEEPRVSGQVTQDGGQQVGDTTQPAQQVGETAQPAQQARGTAQPVQQASGTAQPVQLPQHVVKRTRLGGLWLASGSFAVVLLLLLIFILENGKRVD